MAEIVTLMSGKGGVGKTSIAVNLAHFLANYGLKTLLVDCDLNTNGATTFFELSNHLSKTANQYVSFSQILQRLIDEREMKIKAETLEQKYIEIEANMDFIPAIHTGYVCREGYSNDILSEIQREFYELIGIWEKSYDVIIFDQAAGYTDIIEFMMTFSTKVFMIRECNVLSLEATRKLYKKIIGKCEEKKILCCINKIPTHKYGKQPEPQWEGIISQCFGFEYEECLAERLECGELVSIDDNKYAETMFTISKFIFPMYYQKLNEYTKMVEEIEEQSILMRQREREGQCGKQLILNLLITLIISIGVVVIMCLIKETKRLMWGLVGFGSAFTIMTFVLAFLTYLDFGECVLIVYRKWLREFIEAFQAEETTDNV